MTKLFRLLSIAAGAALLGPWVSTGSHAQSSACYQTCTIQYNWPASQCASYCRARASERNTGQKTGMFGPAPSTRVYGYKSRQGAARGPGRCGTNMYWKAGGCADARNK